MISAATVSSCPGCGSWRLNAVKPCWRKPASCSAIAAGGPVMSASAAESVAIRTFRAQVSSAGRRDYERFLAALQLAGRDWRDVLMGSGLGDGD
jgi:hypothetical protein